MSGARYLDCRHCTISFDVDSPEKRAAGGYINECPDCISNLGTKDVPIYLGVQAGNGKMMDITLLKFKNEKDRDNFNDMWKANTGYYKGKSCQLGRGLVSTSGYNFEVLGEFRGNDNHKGKA